MCIYTITKSPCTILKSLFIIAYHLENKPIIIIIIIIKSGLKVPGGVVVWWWGGVVVVEVHFSVQLKPKPS